MRNFNTSFAKNAIRFFAIEASQVLRALASLDPAKHLLRLIKSIVRTYLDVIAPTGYRLSYVQPTLQAIVQTGTPTWIGRVLSTMSVGNRNDEHGICRWDCRLSQAVS